jgi:Short-chain dehydrogenases of various substrate specificities
VQHLARRGAKVYLAARDESRATEAIARLESEGLGPGNGDVIWLQLDLVNPRTAKMAAMDFLTRETRLDVLGMVNFLFY